MIDRRTLRENIYQKLRKNEQIAQIHEWSQKYHQRKKILVIRALIRRHRFAQLIGYLSGLIIGINLYVYTLRFVYDDRVIQRQIGDNIMYLDLFDTGVSSQLLTRGAREVVSSNAYTRELERLKVEVNGRIIVLDIGANIGYFVLLAANVLKDRQQIYAIEPNPDTIALLERNVCVNGYSDQITISQYAVGDESGSRQLLVSKGSNWSRIDNDPDQRRLNIDRQWPGIHHRLQADPRAIFKSVPVQMVTGAEYLEEQNLNPASVNAIRLDLEGYERSVLEGLEPVLQSPGPLLIFIEIHDDIESMCSMFQEYGFKLVSAAKNDYPIQADNLEDVKRVSEWVELVIKKDDQ